MPLSVNYRCMAVANALKTAYIILVCYYRLLELNPVVQDRGRCSVLLSQHLHPVTVKKVCMYECTLLKKIV